MTHHHPDQVGGVDQALLVLGGEAVCGMAAHLSPFIFFELSWNRHSPPACALTVPVEAPPFNAMGTVAERDMSIPAPTLAATSDPAVTPVI